jgi:hypothetical protein
MSDEITKFIAKAQGQGVPVPAKAESALRKSLAENGAAVSDDVREAFVQKFLEGLKSIVKPVEVTREAAQVTEGETPSSLVGDLTKFLGRYENPQALVEELNLPFKLDVATSVMRGAGRLLAQNFDQDELDEFPALELLRVYERDVPRGFKSGPKGTLIPVPDNDWPSRFEDACTTACDDDALRVLKETGRMIALKSSGVWDELGSNRDDTLGNSYPPFAFNSGYDVDGVPRKEAEELGLIEPGEKAERADVDFENLFSLN